MTSKPADPGGVPAGCLSEDTLILIACGRRVDPASQAHADACPRCRDSVAQWREEIGGADRHVRHLAADALRAGNAPTTSIPAGDGDEPRADLPEIPGFRLLSVISSGGQGVLYAGIQLGTRRRVAVKIPMTGALTKGALERFEREARIAANLRHPNIVTVFESGKTWDGVPFVAMEYVSGMRLDEEASRRRAGRGDPAARQRRFVEIFAKIASAVEHAHSQGVIHRDIKPANILVDRAGEPRLVDFGIARTLNMSEGSPTLTGAFLGTPAYASPEQVGHDEGGIDVRTDVYSLGVVMYEILAGHRPYNGGDTPISWVDAILKAEPAKLREVVTPAGEPRIATDLALIVGTCLQKSRSDRYQAAANVREDLQRYLRGEPISARHDSVMYVLRRAARRHKAPFIGAGAVLLALLVGAAIILYSTVRLRAKNAELRDAVDVATIERARMMLVVGDAAAAGNLIREIALSRSDLGTGADDGTLRRLRWSAWEHALRQPALATFDLGAIPRTMWFEGEGEQAVMAAACTDGRIIRVRAMPCEIVSESRMDLPGPVMAAFKQADDRLVVFGDSWICVTDSRNGALASTTDLAGMFPGGMPPILFDDANRLVLDVATPDGPIRRAIRTSDFTIVASGSTDELPAEWQAINHQWTAFTRVDGEQRLLFVRTSAPQSVRAFALPDLFVAGATGSPLSLTMDPRARRLVGIVGADVRMWDFERPSQPPVEIVRLPRVLRSRSLSPDGALMAFGMVDGEIRVVDVRSASPVATLLGHSLFTSALEFSANGGFLASADGSNRVKLWDLRAASPLHVFPTSAESVLAASIAPSGTLVGAALEQARTSGVGVWDTRAGRWLWSEPEVRAGATRDVRFSADSARLLECGDDGVVRERDARTGARLHEVTLGQRVDGAAYIADGGVLLTLKDGTIAFWSPRSEGSAPGTLQRVAAHKARIAYAAVSPDGRRAVLACADGTASLWNTVARRRIATLNGPGVPTRTACFTPDVLRAITGSDDGSIRVWDARTGAPIASWHSALHNIYGLSVHPKSDVLAACGADRRIRIVDLRSGAELAAIETPTSSVFTIAWSPDGDSLLAGGDQSPTGPLFLVAVERYWPFAEDLLRPVTRATGANMPGNAQRKH